MRAHTIYVIEGSTGDYDEHTTWCAAWATTREDAERIANVMREEAAATYERVERDEIGRLESRMTMLDRRYVHSSDRPARYYVVAVHDAPPNAMSTCPWCDREFPEGTDYNWKSPLLQPANWREMLPEVYIHTIAPDARVERCPQTPWMRFCWMWFRIEQAASDRQRVESA